VIQPKRRECERSEAELGTWPLGGSVTREDAMLSVTVAHLPPNTARASTGARDEEMRAEVIWFDTGEVIGLLIAGYSRRRQL